MAEFKPIDEAGQAAARRRGDRAGRPRALSARFDRRSHKIRVSLNTGIEFAFDPSHAYGLSDASDEDFVGVTVEGAGGSLHFPKLDADFSVARLLEGFLGPMEWTRSEARAAASRANGRLGGRPRKIARQSA
jgi:hypothetical protein